MLGCCPPRANPWQAVAGHSAVAPTALYISHLGLALSWASSPHKTGQIVAHLGGAFGPLASDTWLWANSARIGRSLRGSPVPGRPRPVALGLGGGPHRDSPLLYSSRPLPGTSGVPLGTLKPRLQSSAVPSSTGSRTTASAVLATGALVASGSTWAVCLQDVVARPEPPSFPSGQPLPVPAWQREPLPLQSMRGGHSPGLVRSPRVNVAARGPAVSAAGPASAAPLIAAPGPLHFKTLLAAAAALLAVVPAWVPAPVPALVAAAIPAPVSALTVCAAPGSLPFGACFLPAAPSVLSVAVAVAVSISSSLGAGVVVSLSFTFVRQALLELPRLAVVSEEDALAAANSVRTLAMCPFLPQRVDLSF